MGAVGRRRTGGVEEDRGGGEDGLGDEVEDRGGDGERLRIYGDMTIDLK